jgi:murein DD-endopeptidase MepM/ murein hydrolase activator NlpD
LNIISQVADASPSKISFAVSNFNARTKMTKSDAQLFEHTLPAGSPMPGTAMTSGYGYREHPIYKQRIFHYGVDFEVPENTPVVATADGVVEFVRESPTGYGRLLTLRHAHDFRTAYAHLNEQLVAPGQIVRKGDVVALSGNSGTSTGPHLHYEIIYQGAPVNPVSFVAMEHATQPAKTARSKAWDSSIASLTP